MQILDLTLPRLPSQSAGLNDEDETRYRQLISRNREMMAMHGGFQYPWLHWRVCSNSHYDLWRDRRQAKAWTPTLLRAARQGLESRL